MLGGMEVIGASLAISVCMVSAAAVYKYYTSPIMWAIDRETGQRVIKLHTPGFVLEEVERKYRNITIKDRHFWLFH